MPAAQPMPELEWKCRSRNPELLTGPNAMDCLPAPPRCGIALLFKNHGLFYDDMESSKNDRLFLFISFVAWRSDCLLRSGRVSSRYRLALVIQVSNCAE